MENSQTTQEFYVERYPALLPKEISRFMGAAEYRVKQFVDDNPDEQPTEDYINSLIYLLEGLLPDYAGMFRPGLDEQASSLIAELLETEFSRYKIQIDLNHLKLARIRKDG